MRKREEIKKKKSCWNKAATREFVFVLLGRDKATPNTIRDWCKRRIALGLNNPSDEQITSALRQADKIEKVQAKQEKKRARAGKASVERQDHVAGVS